MRKRMIAEWEPQSAVLLAMPHEKSDWKPYLNEIRAFYRKLVGAIAERETVVLLCRDASCARGRLNDDRVIFAEISCNDTWTRDFGAISIETDGKIELIDFEFNGWGLKFAANLDNQASGELHRSGVFGKVPMRKAGYILEGGSVETDGKGTIMTTETCLFAPNRNANWSKADFEKAFERDLGAKRVLWLKNGHLENDDTDAHIDTLARFCDARTIAFVTCADKTDPHYKPLLAMRREIEAFQRSDGSPYRLIELPMVDPIYFESERLPATYANFLIVNGAVIAPIYGVKSDAIAIAALKTAFPTREIIPIDASVATRQHGSIHCLTMQFPKGAVVEIARR